MDDAPSPDPRIGTTLQGRYRILEALAQGGMGIVYRAERVGIERQVAIKFLHAFVGANKEAVQRFEREARAMSKLTHPHCVPVIDFGVHEDAPYIVMEYVSGRTLLDVVQNGPLPPGRALHIVSQVLSGLAHAHGQGIVHRDVKPANIVLVEVTGTGDHARILDFGLAKLLDGPGASWSTVQTAVGTPSYMSPEQARGEEVDARADQYAVGIMLFELLTGKKPFYGKDPFEVLKKHMHAEPPPLARAGGPSFSTQLEAVVKRALAKQPGERYASALEFRDALAATPEADDVPRPYSSSPMLPKPVSVEARSAIRPEEAQLRRTDDVAAVKPPRRRGLGVFMLLVMLAGGVFGVRWAREHGVLSRLPGGNDGAMAGDAGEGFGLAELLPDAASAPLLAPPDAAAPDAARPDASPPDAAPPDASPPDAALRDGAPADAEFH
jgi:eukaryotic-like serine/threonine-protein kinase